MKNDEKIKELEQISKSFERLIFMMSGIKKDVDVKITHKKLIRRIKNDNNL